MTRTPLRIVTSSIAASIVGVLMAPSHAAATFPGENGKIAFNSPRVNGGDIFIMNPDGSEKENVTNHPAADGEPAWSPGGNTIAFASTRHGNQEIYS